MQYEDCVYGELVKACFYCGSTNIQITDLGTQLKHKCNVCKKTNVLTKRLKEDKDLRKENSNHYPQFMKERHHRHKLSVAIKRKLKEGELVHHIN